MSDRSPNTFRFSTPVRLGVALLVLLAPFAAAQAYVGPGAGLSLVSALWGLLCAVGAAFLFVILWPLRRMRRKRREAREADNQTQTDETPQAGTGQTQQRASNRGESGTDE